MVAAGHEDRLAGKEYNKAVEALCRNTAVRVYDLDPKALSLLDLLQERGRAEEACQFLTISLSGIARDKVVSWRAYTYSLLRKFDGEAYLAWKQARAAKQPRASRANSMRKSSLGSDGDAMGDRSLNPSAIEFVPGQLWNCASGAEAAAGSSCEVPVDSYHDPAAAMEFVPGNVWVAACGAGTPAMIYCEGATDINHDPAAVSTDAGSAKSDKEDGADAKMSNSPGGATSSGSNNAEVEALSPQHDIGPAELPSVGSEGHHRLKCKPCAFFSTKGCNSGAQCTFCHLCGPYEKRRRKKERRLRHMARIREKQFPHE